MDILTIEDIKAFEPTEDILLTVKNIMLKYNPKVYSVGFKSNKINKEDIIKFAPCLKDKNPTFGRILYHIFKKLEYVPTCEFCGNDATWGGHNKEYCVFSKYASICENRECRKLLNKKLFTALSKDKEIIAKRQKTVKQTLIEKYGVDNMFATTIIKDARRNSWKENKDEQIQKRIQTNLKKYGCEFANQNAKVKEKLKKSMNSSTAFTIDRKVKQRETCMKKYGNKCVFGSEYFKNKTKETLLEEYGVSHNSQMSSMREKQIKSLFAHKEYSFPSGKKSFVQGYENIALDDLLKTYDENDIFVGDKEIEDQIGIIWYSFENNKHRYYPDIYIKSENKIIEVKSEYTYMQNKNKNIAKKNACIEMGFNFEFVIYD